MKKTDPLLRRPVQIITPVQNGTMDPARSWCTASAASEGTPVEFSVNGGAWRSARREDGLWKFRLPDLVPGEHRLAARIAVGNKLSVALRRFNVI
jgi:hypothetical protein